LCLAWSLIKVVGCFFWGGGRFDEDLEGLITLVITYVSSRSHYVIVMRTEGVESL
jgi:hypothetical protein